jgi:hypothetical protein
MSDIIKRLASQFILRSEALDYKGKKRDAAVLDFFVGAANALDIIEHPEAHRVKAVCMILSVRGYAEVKLLANPNNGETAKSS